MKAAWFTSPYRVVTISVVNVILTVLALIAMLARRGISERTAAASLLVLSFMIFFVAGVLFNGRVLWKWEIKNLSTYMTWERSLVIVPTVTTSLGLVLLSDMLTEGGDIFLARLGMMAYLFGAVLVVSAETTFVSKSEWNYAQVILYVMLALLGQAAIGAALLHTGFAAVWVGWVTVLWNVIFLIIFIIVRPRDVYYPAIHFIAPLVIGLGLVSGM
jgi:energy-converting hydrogenase Eha subunit A